MPAIIACHECDLLQRQVALEPGTTARCARCGAALYKRPIGGLDRTLAWVVSALVLFVLANAFPILILDIQGTQTAATLIRAGRVLYEQGQGLVGALVLFTTVVGPGLGLASMLYLLGALHFGRVPPGFADLMRMLHAVSPWVMLDVFMLGILVSLVKLLHLATVIPGIGLWSFVGLMLTFVAAAASYDAHEVWARMDALEQEEREANEPVRP